MKTERRLGVFVLVAAAAISIHAADIKVDLSKETVGQPPKTFQGVVGTWVVAQDGPDKVIKLDGAIWKAAQSNEGRMLIESARKLYGVNNEELMDNAKMFANFPIAVLNGLDNFTNGSISLKFKTVAGDSDRAAGILFNVKENGDWLAVRYNDPEHNISLWEFHNGVRRAVARPASGRNQLTHADDMGKWHEMKLDVDDANLKTYLNGVLVLEYALGTDPAPGRGGAPANADLFAANNPVLRPPVKGRIGLWSKGDSTTHFKDFVVIQK